MKDLFSKEDILSLKWKILLVLVCLLVAGSIFYLAGLMNSDMANGLHNAQSELQNARTNIDQIAEEEATIIEYIGRYQELAADGIVDPEDRLQLLELFTEIRREHDLFPIRVSIEEQSTINLVYDPYETAPGGPINVNVNVTNVSMGLPLLHEGDLISLLDSLLDTTGLYVLKECSVSLRNPSQTNFIVLGQYQEAECDLLWFTFDVDPPLPVQPFF